MASEVAIELVKRQLAEADERVGRQAAMVKQLVEDGQDTTQADELLAEYRVALKAMHERLLRLEAEG